MPTVFKHRFCVPADAIDTNHHVNNVAYVQWMQNAAVLHSDAQGCTAETYQRLKATWVVRSHQIDYLTPAFAGEEIEVATWVANLKRSRSLRKFKFFRTKDHALLAQAQTEWVYVDLSTGRPCVIHPEIKAAFDIVPSEQEP